MILPVSLYRSFACNIVQLIAIANCSIAQTAVQLKIHVMWIMVVQVIEILLLYVATSGSQALKGFDIDTKYTTLIPPRVSR